MLAYFSRSGVSRVRQTPSARNLFAPIAFTVVTVVIGNPEFLYWLP